MSENSEASTNSRLGGGNPLIRAGVLRPSVLGTTIDHNNHTGAGAASTLFDANNEEPTFNPFMKAEKDDDEANDVKEDSEAIATTIATTTDKATDKELNHEKKPVDDDEETDEQRPDPLKLLRKNGIERANLFAAAKSSVENSGFVFGQNVHERVVGENVKPDSCSKSENADSTSGELLFSSVIQNATKTTAVHNEPEDGSSTADATSTAGATASENEVKSLTEVAREYEESRAQKRKFEEVETFTGEENEVNIVDISCKLFAFVNSNWEERGRGSLRLNDSKTEKGCSRVVFRTSGNLRLLLNTKVWAGMVAERPSQKSLRLTAMDNTGKIKVFLAQARPVEISQLYKALVQRIDLRKSSHPEEGNAVATMESNGGGSSSEQSATNNGETISTAPAVETDKATKPISDQEDSAEPSQKKTGVVTQESE